MLDLSATQIDNKSLTSVVGLTRLERLFLKETTIDDLTFLKQFPNLIELNLELSRKIDDKALEPILTLKRLETLNLSTTNVSDQGLLKLASLGSLIQLSVHNCPKVTRAGVMKVANLMPACALDSDDTIEHIGAWRKANALARRQQYDQAIAMYKSTMQSLDKNKRLTPAFLTRGMCGIAESEVLAGRPENAAEAALVAAQSAADTHMRRKIGRLLDKIQLDLYNQRSKKTNASTSMKAICEGYTRLGSEAEPEKLTTCWVLYFSKLERDQNYRKVLAEYKEPIDALKRAGLKDDCEMLGRIISLKANAEMNTNNFNQARSSFNKAISLLKKTEISSAPESLIGAYHGLALLNNKDGRINEAIATEKKAIHVAQIYNQKQTLSDLYNHLKYFQGRLRDGT